MNSCMTLIHPLNQQMLQPTEAQVHREEWGTFPSLSDIEIKSTVNWIVESEVSILTLDIILGTYLGWPYCFSWL